MRIIIWKNYLYSGRMILLFDFVQIAELGTSLQWNMLSNQCNIKNLLTLILEQFSNRDKNHSESTWVLESFTDWSLYKFKMDFNASGEIFEQCEKSMSMRWGSDFTMWLVVSSSICSVQFLQHKRRSSGHLKNEYLTHICYLSTKYRIRSCVK